MVICLTVSSNGVTTVFVLHFQAETVHKDKVTLQELKCQINHHPTSNLETVPPKETVVICDFRVCFLLFIFLRKSPWSSFVPEPAQPELQQEELTEVITTKCAALLFTEQHLPEVKGK